MSPRALTHWHRLGTEDTLQVDQLYFHQRIKGLFIQALPIPLCHRHPVELSVLVAIFYICAVQCSNRRAPKMWLVQLRTGFLVILNFNLNRCGYHTEEHKTKLLTAFLFVC